MAKRLTFKEFVEKATDIHDGVYKYKEDTYTNTRGDVSIVCPTHGEFVQKAFSHLQGRTCPTCGQEKREETKRQNAIIRNLKSFSFDQSIYKVKVSPLQSATDPCEVLCRKHMTTYTISSLRNLRKTKTPCHECVKEGLVKDFITKLEDRFDHIDHSSMEYVNSQTKVKLRCKLHNHYFEIKPNKVLASYYGGCSECYKNHKNSRWSLKTALNSSSGEEEYYFYLAKISPFKDYHKIGITKKFRHRTDSYKSDLRAIGIDPRISYLGYKKTTLLCALNIEEHLKTYLSSCKADVEIKFGGYTEMYNLDEEQFNYIMSVINGDKDLMLDNLLNYNRKLLEESYV